jgi:hypothetical protein
LLNTFLEGLGVEPEQVDKMQIVEPLFEDVKHKLHEIVQEARKVMRHSKREHLTADDIKLAMSKLNVSNIFGYPSYAPQYEFQQLSIPAQQVGNPGATEAAEGA